MSGRLSGDPHGYMAGFICETFDRWVLGRRRTGRAEELSGIFDLDSPTLHGATHEVRLWTESAGAHGRLSEYIRFHHAAVGAAFMHWEGTTCR